jgi:hypothetical protein
MCIKSKWKVASKHELKQDNEKNMAMETEREKEKEKEKAMRIEQTSILR